MIVVFIVTVKTGEWTKHCRGQQKRERQTYRLPHPKTHWTHCMQKCHRYSLSLVGRGFFSFVSVFFSLVLSKLAISVRSGLSDMFAVNRDNRCDFQSQSTDLALSSAFHKSLSLHNFASQPFLRSKYI